MLTEASQRMAGMMHASLLEMSRDFSHSIVQMTLPAFGYCTHLFRMAFSVVATLVLDSSALIYNLHETDGV